MNTVKKIQLFFWKKMAAVVVQGNFVKYTDHFTQQTTLYTNPSV